MPFSSWMLMITVFAAVIFGVTSSFSAASLNWMLVVAVPPAMLTT